MEDFHFSFGLLMPFDHILHHGFRRVELFSAVNGRIVFNLLFNQRNDLLVFDQLFSGKSLSQAFGDKFNHIIIISQVFEITLARFQSGSRFALDDLFVQTQERIEA